MKLPIQAPPVLRAWAPKRLGGVARVAGGLLPAAGDVDCSATGNCSAWTCSNGQTCNGCVQTSRNGPWVGQCK